MSMMACLRAEGRTVPLPTHLIHERGMQTLHMLRNAHHELQELLGKTLKASEAEIVADSEAFWTMVEHLAKVQISVMLTGDPPTLYGHPVRVIDKMSPDVDVIAWLAASIKRNAEIGIPHWLPAIDL